ncbi:high mobility group box domain-containing protein, partial [Panaeolus papilionaceus]
IPRPRNPFILFRTNFVRQQRIPNSVESDHRNISRIVGRLWNAMTEEQREPWKVMAVREREEHAKIHPGYRFTP